MTKYRFQENHSRTCVLGNFTLAYREKVENPLLLSSTPLAISTVTITATATTTAATTTTTK